MATNEARMRVLTELGQQAGSILASVRGEDREVLRDHLGEVVDAEVEAADVVRAHVARLHAPSVSSEPRDGYALGDYKRGLCSSVRDQPGKW